MLSNDGKGICPTKPDTGPLKTKFVSHNIFKGSLSHRISIFRHPIFVFINLVKVVRKRKQEFDLECQTEIRLTFFLKEIKAKVDFVTTPTQPQLNSKVGCDMKTTLHHHHHPPPTTHRKFNVGNISAVTGQILMKL